MDISRLNSRWIRVNFSDDFSWHKVNEVKKIPGREYDPETEDWKVPLKTKGSCAQFLHFCNEFDIKLPDSIEKLIKELRQDFKERERREARNREIIKGADSSIDRIYGTARGMRLRDYQRAAVEYAAENKRVIIGDEQGLGKTVEAIGTVQHLESYPVLCVVPAAVRPHWEKEWNTWIPRRTVKTVRSGSHSDFRGSIVICTYSLIYKFTDRFKDHGFEALICDESHKLKNNSAKRSKAVRKISKDIPVRMLLTGTPSINKPAEFINQLKILGVFKDAFGGWMQYTDRYCNRKDSQFGQWDISGASNLEELHNRLVGNCYVRRNKDDDDILDELPEKQRTVVELDINNRKKYDEVENNLAKHLREKFKEDEELLEKIEHLSEPLQEAHKEQHANRRVEQALNAEHLVKINELRKVTSRGKFKESKKWIKNFLESGENLLLFAHYKETTRKLADEFDCPRITGDVSTSEREEIIEEFQDGQHQLLVLNIEAGGVGITLTEASNVAFVEIPWTFAEIEQAEDRCILEGEPIMTENGWVPVEQVGEGDRVIGHDGKPHEVLDSWDRKAKGSHAHNSKSITEISVIGWPKKIKTTSDHRILTNEGWTQAGDIHPRDEIKMPDQYEGEEKSFVEVSKSSRLPSEYETPEQEMFGSHYDATYTKKKTTQKNHGLIKIPDRLELTDKMLFCLGYYVGNGHCYTGTEKGRYVSLAAHVDQMNTHLTECQQWFDKLDINSTIREHSDRDGCELRAYSGELALWFENNLGRKLDEKTVPEWIHECSKEQRETFVNGWFEADGYERRGRKQIITAKKDLASEACRLLMGLGKKPSITYGEESGSYTVGWTEGVDPTLKVTEVKHRTCNRQERVYDLTVEDSNSFVVGTSAVHNCHRFGQKDTVNVYFMLADDTIDREMFDLVRKKKAITDQVNKGREVEDIEQQDIMAGIVERILNRQEE